MLKTLVGAVALTFAVPALAQPAPAADPHAGHAPDGQANPGQHGHAREQRQHSGHGSHGGGHPEHTMECCKDCCSEERQGGATKPSCDKHGDAAPDGAADHSQHGN